MESSISIIDIVAVILVIMGMIHGFRQGVSPGFSWLCGALIGLLCAIFTFPALASFINTSGEVDETLLAFCSLMGSVIVAVLVLFFIRFILAQFARFGSTLIMDRIGGAFAGVIQTTFIILLAYIALTSIDQPSLHKAFGEQSALGRPIVAIKDRISSSVESDYTNAQHRMLQQREERSDKRTQPR
jgi:uncharacterized membrane protein required for colicin V production